MTNTIDISAKNLSFEDLCAHTKGFVRRPDKHLYEKMHAHLDLLFTQMHACNLYASTDLAFNNVNNLIKYEESHNHSAHKRMSSPWLREEEKNITLLKNLGKQVNHFIIDTFFQELRLDSVWYEKDCDYICLFFNEIRAQIKYETSASLCAFLICAIHASFMNNRTRNEVISNTLRSHTFDAFRNDNEALIKTIGTDIEDAERIYYEGIQIAKFMNLKFSEFSFFG